MGAPAVYDTLGAVVTYAYVANGGLYVKAADLQRAPCAAAVAAYSAASRQTRGTDPQRLQDVETF